MRSAIPCLGLVLWASVDVMAAPMNAANRSSGVAPLAVFFDAVQPESGVAAPPSQSSFPAYASTHYEWSFGDDADARWLTSGKSKNLAVGYVAGHVFEFPGSFRVMLRVTEPDGYVHEYEQDIEVADPEMVYANLSPDTADRTLYVSSEGSDLNDGSFNRPFQTWERGREALFSGHGPRRLLLRRGDTFTHLGTRSIRNRIGPFTITAYGTGANPVILQSGVSSPVVNLHGDVSDVRVMDVDFAGLSPGIAVTPGTNTLILRTRMSNFSSGVSTSDVSGNKAGNFFVDNVIEQNDRYGIYYNFGENVAILGNLIGDVNGEHLVRCYLTHSLIGHNVFRGGRIAKHQLKFVGYFPTGDPFRPEGTPTEVAEFSIISDNRFENPEDINWIVTLGPTDPLRDQRIENLIFERNLMRAATAVSDMLVVSNSLVTVRNNVFDATGGSIRIKAVRIMPRGIEPPPFGHQVLQNTIYRADPFRVTAVQVDSSATGIVVMNNLAGSTSGRMLVVGLGAEVYEEGNLLTSTLDFGDPAGDDFSLLPGSPGIDAGADLPSVRADAGGRGRPIDGDDSGSAQWDVGAYEFQPGPPPVDFQR